MFSKWEWWLLTMIVDFVKAWFCSIEAPEDDSRLENHETLLLSIESSSSSSSLLALSSNSYSSNNSAASSKRSDLRLLEILLSSLRIDSCCLCCLRSSSWKRLSWGYWYWMIFGLLLALVFELFSPSQLLSVLPDMLLIWSSSFWCSGSFRWCWSCWLNVQLSDVQINWLTFVFKYIFDIRLLDY